MLFYEQIQQLLGELVASNDAAIAAKQTSESDQAAAMAAAEVASQSKAAYEQGVEIVKAKRDALKAALDSFPLLSRDAADA